MGTTLRVGLSLAALVGVFGAAGAMLDHAMRSVPALSVQPAVPRAQTLDDISGCPEGYMDDPAKPGSCTLAPGFAIDTSQTDAMNASVEQRYTEQRVQHAQDDRDSRLRQQIAESSYQTNRAIEEAAFNAQQAQAQYRTASTQRQADETGYQARSYNDPPVIRDRNGMPSVTTVQVAPDRVWDYSTGQYHWADQQADGSIQERP